MSPIAADTSLKPKTLTPMPPPATPGETRVTSIAHQKGGVGKSAGAINLAYEAVARGKNVLVIDMDGQGTATRGLVDRQPLSPQASVFGVIVGESQWEDIILLSQVEGLHLAPSHMVLTQLQAQLGSRGVAAGQERQLAKRMPHLKGYDHIFIDCPPSLDTATICALVASTEIVIPTQLEGPSMEGLWKVADLLKLISEDVGIHVPLKAIYPSMCGTNNRARLEQDMLEDLRDAFGNVVTTTQIRRTVKVPEAYANRLPLGAYQPDHVASGDYANLYTEIWGE